MSGVREIPDTRSAEEKCADLVRHLREAVEHEEDRPAIEAGEELPRGLAEIPASNRGEPLPEGIAERLRRDGFDVSDPDDNGVRVIRIRPAKGARS